MVSLALVSASLIILRSDRVRKHELGFEESRKKGTGKMEDSGISSTKVTRPRESLTKRSWATAQLVGCLPSINKAMSLISVTVRIPTHDKFLHVILKVGGDGSAVTGDQGNIPTTYMAVWKMTVTPAPRKLTPPSKGTRHAYSTHIHTKWKK